MSRPVFVALVVSLLATSTGCAWLHAKQIEKRTNPAYRSASIPGPTRLLPIFACPRQRRDVEPSAVSRRKLATAIVPALWRAAGGTGDPEVGPEPSPVFCQDLYEGDSTLPWAGNPALRDAVGAQLAPGEESALLIFYALTYECQEEAGKVRDVNGVAIGSIGTGKQLCGENGDADVQVFLFARDGTLVWLSGERVGVAEDGDAVASRIFEGFPRDRVTLAK